MKRIKFKIAVYDICKCEDVFPEITGYLVEIEGIKVVLHNEHYLCGDNSINIDKTAWNASEYYTGRSIARHGSLRRDMLKIVTKTLLNAIEKSGIKRVMKIINKLPKINK